jgi:hypothetical protein
MTGRPYVDAAAVITVENKLDDSQVIFLPISEDDARVSQILVYTVFER